MTEDKHVSFDPETKSEETETRGDSPQDDEWMELLDADSSHCPSIANKLREDSPPPGMMERYKACMLLAGVGDALGFNMGDWEFCPSGARIMNVIHSKYKGIANLIPHQKSKFMLSDDTIMHIATADALVTVWTSEYKLFLTIAKMYVECMKDMAGRAPGGSCMDGTWRISEALRINKYSENRPPYVIPYGKSKGGCGAAMRSVPIGLLYCKEDQMDQLIKVSIESGRMTHHQSTGFLGSLATALLIHLAIREVPPLSWGRFVLQESIKAIQYCRANDRYHRSIRAISSDWGYFQLGWGEYLVRRNILIGDGPVDFKNDFFLEGNPASPSYENHDKFVTQVSYSGFGGSSGHDAPMLAYDAVLYALSVREKEGRAKGWEALCTFGMFHCGDCDSTGIISAAIWGAMFGFEAYESNYKGLEYKDRLLSLGGKLYWKSKELLYYDPLKKEVIPAEPKEELVIEGSDIVAEKDSSTNVVLEERLTSEDNKVEGCSDPVKENVEMKNTEGDTQLEGSDMVTEKSISDLLTTLEERLTPEDSKVVGSSDPLKDSEGDVLLEENKLQKEENKLKKEENKLKKEENEEKSDRSTTVELEKIVKDAPGDDVNM